MPDLQDAPLQTETRTRADRVDRWLSLTAGAPGPQAERFWSEAQKRLEPVICYCSIYDECREADSRLDEPTPVRACEDSGGAVFQR